MRRTRGSRNAYVTSTTKLNTITAIVEKFRDFQASQEASEELNKCVVRLAGRIASPPRVMGKAAFVHLSDGMSRLQSFEVLAPRECLIVFFDEWDRHKKGRLYRHPAIL